jgi:hypothetical protein
MPKYNVLMQTHQYVEVEAEDARDAEMEAYDLWKSGGIDMDNYPTFVCDECDMVEEEKNAD